MEYRMLGQSSLKISAIGFGCMSLGADEVENTSLIHAAVDGGINFFDTADLYDKGRNEQHVGAALKGRRGQVILATKVGNQWRPDGSGWDWNPTKEYIVKAVEESLRRLQTDYIDLYQLHGGMIMDDADDTLAAFKLLQQQGKIRYYGISSIRPNVIRRFVNQSEITSVMLQYSLLDRRPQETITALLQEHNIGILARGALAQGLLAGKTPKDYLGHSSREVSKAAQQMKELAGESRSAGQTAIQYVLQQPGVSAVICGIRDRLQLMEALTAPQTGQFSPEETRQLEAAVTAKIYTDHR